MTNWQARYEAADTPWDEGVPHPALLDYIAEHGIFRGRILVPGSGFGHDVRGLAAPENEVIGLDLAPAAIEGARARPSAATEKYVLGDLFQPPPDFLGAFDWMIEHTCFCAIDPAQRPAYVEAAARLLRPGGRLFAIFYLNPAAENRPPFGVALEELDALFSARFELLAEWTPARTFEGREGRERVRLLRLQGG